MQSGQGTKGLFSKFLFEILKDELRLTLFGPGLKLSTQTLQYECLFGHT